MALVNSLLTAIVRADGDALVLHAGERPYVVAPAGQSEIASRVLTLDAVTGMLGELLPEEARRTLDDVGAVQHDLTRSAVSEGERFTVVAARGGDDIWIEIAVIAKRRLNSRPLPRKFMPPPRWQHLPRQAGKSRSSLQSRLRKLTSTRFTRTSSRCTKLISDADEIQLDCLAHGDDQTYVLEPATEAVTPQEPVERPEPVGS